jgi:hypothetical protein
MIMRHHVLTIVAAGSLLTIPCVGAQARAQAPSLAQRVRAVRDGMIELRYAARPGVCGNGFGSFSIGRSMHIGDGVSVGGSGWYDSCVPGPVRVRLQAEQGAVRVVRFDVGPSRSRDAASDVTDLGVVPAAAAAEYLLDLAASGSGSGARAITAAALADSASVWRRLLAIARDSSARSRSTRHEAAFWLAQFSAAKLDGRGESFVIPDGDDDRDDPRSSAIFALSQLRNREGIEPLLQIARTNHDARLRRKALFWLGESVDPRAIALFGEIMGG